MIQATYMYTLLLSDVCGVSTFSSVGAEVSVEAFSVLLSVICVSCYVSLEPELIYSGALFVTT